DFYRLYQEYGCSLQIGGGDQWGNLTSSLELIRKKETNAQAEVFSVKLITDSEGRKFGKSERGALYLNPDMCSPYYIYQYFINVSDLDFARYIRIFDDRDLDDIQKDIDKHNACPERRLGQKQLAYLIVSQLHSSAVADDCVKMSEALFQNSFSDLSESQVLEVAEGITHFDSDESELNILDALIKVNLAKSRREGREFVSNGSVRINGEKIQDVEYVIKNGEGLYGNMFFIRRGKKSYAFLKF
ncbi:MAG: tyrosine--tRNA ligase, partial [Bacilli bacterium]|nr:tyrosine--tRNA ligase [Bacilli bacterium]